MADEPTRQPERVITGNCPRCTRVVVIFNNHEVWPLIRCECGWHGQTTAILRYSRRERGDVSLEDL